MQDYRDLEPEELATIPSFRRWKLNHDPAEEAFWTEWLRSNPDKKELLDKATSLILGVRSTFDQVTDEEVKAEMGRLSSSISSANTSVRTLSFRRNIQWYGMAASIALALGLGWWFVGRGDNSPEGTTYQELITEEKSVLIERINDTDQPMLLTLPDQSTLLLQPHSRISHLPEFTHSRREVYLSGEAFFEVFKNPEKPFYVYANSLVTKVLGTSFTVRAYDTEKQVKVAVKTGKVSVFVRSEENLTSQQATTKLGGMVLTPNQQIVFSPKNTMFVRSLIEEPTLLELPIQAQSFDFKGTPIADVFTTLEKAYGIRIIFDAEIMKNCYLTASLGDEPLFEKINLICKTLDANYEQMDATIIITSKGC